MIPERRPTDDRPPPPTRTRERVPLPPSAPTPSAPAPSTPTRTALAIRHVPFEDLGLLGPLLTERGYRVRYLDAGIDDLDTDLAATADLLVALGGPVGVGDRTAYPFLDQEIALLAQRLDRGRPVLGICLGAQLIATALGAAVTPARCVEIGYAPVELASTEYGSALAPLGDTPVLHWHGDEFHTPAGAVRLAATPTTRHQAFALGDTVLALQFHLEVDHTDIERWLIGHAHELASHGVDPGAVRRDAARYGPVLADRARAVFAGWLDRLGPDPRSARP